MFSKQSVYVIRVSRWNPFKSRLVQGHPISHSRLGVLYILGNVAEMGGKMNTSYTNQKEEIWSLIIDNHQFHKSLANISEISYIIN